MQTLLEALGGVDGCRAPDLIRGVDAWCAEVLVLRSDSLGLEVVPHSSHRQLDHLFGAYVARERLALIPGSAELRVTAVVDALFESFTEEVGRDWIALTGMEMDAGDGWWWARLPVAGPARDDFDEAFLAGHAEDAKSDG